MKARFVSFAFLSVSLGVMGCGGEKPSQEIPAEKPVPSTRFALWDGVAVSRFPIRAGDQPLRTLTYGEAITAFCEQNTCTFSENGIKAAVNEDATALDVPARTLFVWGDANVYDHEAGGNVKRRLKNGEKVEVRRYQPAVGTNGPRVAIGENQWVGLPDLRDRPETKEERRARVAEAAAAAKGEREAAKAAAAAAIEARRSYGETLRNHFLDQGMDVKVRVSGSRADRLTLEFVLFNAVWTRKMETGSLLGEIRDQGFQRLDMKDGYDYHVYWNWK
jgi:hypothetical protein